MLAFLAALCITAVAAKGGVGGPLNKDISAFQPINIEQDEVLHRPMFARDLQPRREQFNVHLRAFDKQLTLVLEPSLNLFTSDFRAVSTDGPIDMSDRQYYHGRVAGQTNRSFVHFRVANDGSCHGSIQTDDEQYELEPAHWHFDTPQAGFNHVMHRLSDNANKDLPKLNTCQTITAPQPDVSEDSTETRERRAGFDSSKTACGVALVADKLFYASKGGSDRTVTTDKMVAAFNKAKELYANNAIAVDGVNIGIRIGFIEVATNDKYKLVTTVGNDFLKNFAETNWDAYCLAHLFTRQEFADGLLGLAYLGRTDSAVGGICQQRSGGYNYNSGFSTYINYGNDVPDQTAWLVLAHELGHNFGAGHDDDSEESDGEFLMYPVSVTGSEANNYEFSPKSKTSIRAVVDAKGGCFTDPDEPICGNNVQEDDEECDGGGTGSTADSCCSVFVSPSDGDASNNCKLDDPSYECSPFHLTNGRCCDDSTCMNLPGTPLCREETECLKAVNCAAGVCGEPDEFRERTYCSATNKDRLCNDEGECAMSICEVFGFTDILAIDDEDERCKVTCDTGNEAPTLVSELLASAKENANRLSTFDRAGAQDTSDFATGEIIRSNGARCRMKDQSGKAIFGVCDDGECKNAEGGATAFDELEAFIRNLSAEDIKNWLTRTDNFIPNYGWLLIGLLILSLIIACLCKISNAKDKKAGIKA